MRSCQTIYWQKQRILCVCKICTCIRMPCNLPSNLLCTNYIYFYLFIIGDWLLCDWKKLKYLKLISFHFFLFFIILFKVSQCEINKLAKHINRMSTISILNHQWVNLVRRSNWQTAFSIIWNLWWILEFELMLEN